MSNYDTMQGDVPQAPTPARAYEGHLVGQRFHPPATVACDHMPNQVLVLLQRQPDNPHDVNAIQVLLPEESIPETPPPGNPIDRATFVKLMKGELAEQDMDPDLFQWPIMLGYIDRQSAVGIAPEMDAELAFPDPKIKAQAYLGATGRWRVRVEIEQRANPTQASTEVQQPPTT